MEIETISQLDQNDIKFLNDYFPLIENAFHSYSNFKNRVNIIKAYNLNNISFLFIYNSNYNPHIWYSPIIWAFGNPDLISKSINYIMKKNIIKNQFIALTYSKEKIKGITHIKTYNEDLLILKKLSINKINDKYKIIKLKPEDANESLHLSNAEHFNNNSLNAEKLFIEERETYGIFDNNKLVCRGSIMSRGNNYAAIGGFITDVSYRGNAFATSLIYYISSKLISLNYIPFLTVRTDNLPAQNLYRKLGFEFRDNVTFYDYNTGLRP